MKLTSLATLAALIVGHVSASPVEDVLTPTGIPATSGLPFSTLSFDTTAPSSLLSALSSLISSESTAIMPLTTPPPNSSGSVAASSLTYPSSSARATGVTITSAVTSTPTSTSTSGAYSWRDVRSGMVVGVVVGAVAALIQA